jgi:aquaporin Z
MKRFVAECIGTFLLIFNGIASILVNQQTNGQVGLLGIALAFGLTVTGIAFMFGPVSGAHLNPAVTIGLTAARRFAGKDVPAYLAAQFLGALAASLLLLALFPDQKGLGTTLPQGPVWQSFVIEVIMTYFLMLVILRMTATGNASGHQTALVVGLIIVAMVLFGGPVSGTSLNPTRSLAPAMVIGQFQHLWLYLIAPTLGALLAAFNERWFEAAD